MGGYGSCLDEKRGRKMKTIAIIDDDVYIGDLLEEVLHREGYKTLRAYSGTEALLLLKERKPDLILLDLMLPGLSGEELLPRIQGVPVIIVSAKTDVTDKVKLLLEGAVDYITKPFDNKELTARILVQLRKGSSTEKEEGLSYDEIEMNVEGLAVTVAKQPVRLTKTEFAILKHLLRSRERIMTKSQLLDLIFDDTPDCTENTLKVHISNLRKKLREINGKDYIEAVWGIGFQLHVE